MESMVTSELRKQEEFLRNSFREKYNLPENEIDNIIKDINNGKGFFFADTGLSSE